MKKPDFVGCREDGTIVLGNHVSSDGMVQEHNKVIVFSHAHEDHVTNNSIADAYLKDKKVVMSDDTRKLCATTMLCNLVSDYNLDVLEYGKELEFDDFSIKLLEAGHILGSSQILVNDKKYGKLGYSGDIGENINSFIDADILVLDSTYSGEHTNRKWTMQDSMSQLVEDIKKHIDQDDINIVADPGLLELILHELNIWNRVPIVIGDKKEAGWSQVYKEKHYEQPNAYVLKGTDEERELKIQNQFNITVAHNRSKLDENPKGITYIAKNFGIENEEPINEVSEKFKLVGLSCHATGKSILNYVEKVSPDIVITDSSRTNTENAKKLAKIVQQEAGIQSFTSDEIKLKNF